jgi:hypothetical protein
VGAVKVKRCGRGHTGIALFPCFVTNWPLMDYSPSVWPLAIGTEEAMIPWLLVCRAFAYRRWMLASSGNLTISFGCAALTDCTIRSRYGTQNREVVVPYAPQRKSECSDRGCDSPLPRRQLAVWTKDDDDDFTAGRR